MNFDKRELPASSTRHLGFRVDLIRKVALVTKKHRDRIHAFFDGFLVAVRKKQRIAVKRLQKMLGLQIWISTVFRIARQFLTSICDAIRALGQGQKYFYLGKTGRW